VEKGFWQFSGFCFHVRIWWFPKPTPIPSRSSGTGSPLEGVIKFAFLPESGQVRSPSANPGPLDTQPLAELGDRDWFIEETKDSFFCQNQGMCGCDSKTAVSHSTRQPCFGRLTADGRQKPSMLS